MDHPAPPPRPRFLKRKSVSTTACPNDCLIRDLSEGGARLQISDSVAGSDSSNCTSRNGMIPAGQFCTGGTARNRRRLSSSSLSESETTRTYATGGPLESDSQFASARRDYARDLAMSSQCCDETSVNPSVHVNRLPKPFGPFTRVRNPICQNSKNLKRIAPNCGARRTGVLGWDRPVVSGKQMKLEHAASNVPAQPTAERGAFSSTNRTPLRTWSSPTSVALAP